METKDGKDYINFSIGSSSAGSPVETPRRKSSGRRKPPSQIRRDMRRKEIFLAKKNGESLDTKNTSDTKESKEDATIREPNDEIELTKLSDTNCDMKVEGNLFKIVGEYKNPKFKPWEVVEPKNDLKNMWEILKKENEKVGIEEIGEGSACFEHCLEFWGTWRSKTSRNTEFFKDTNNWPKGVKILEVKHA